MGDFKPMVKMETTEPSIELKLKKGGDVSSAFKNAKKSAKGENGHKPMAHKAMGGMMGALAGAQPMVAGPAPALSARAPAKPSMAQRRKAMMASAAAPVLRKEGGKAYATGGVVNGQGGFKTGGVVKGQAGYKTGGVAKGQGGYKKGGKATGGTIMPVSVNASSPSATSTIASATPAPTSTPVKTPATATPLATSTTPVAATAVRGATNQGGYNPKPVSATGSTPYAGDRGERNRGGMGDRSASTAGPTGSRRIDSDDDRKFSSSSPTRSTRVENDNDNEANEVRSTTMKKGGATKKFANGGSAVKMPQGNKNPSKPVRINELSGTFKKGGKVKKYADGGDAMQRANTKGYNDTFANETAENEADAKAVRDAMMYVPKKIKGLYDKAKNALSGQGAVTDTKTTVSRTVSPPAQKRGGRAGK